MDTMLELLSCQGQVIAKLDSIASCQACMVLNAFLRLSCHTPAGYLPHTC